MSLTGTLRQDWLASPRADILAGIVVALALIPEAIGFSIIAGVDPRVGLYASFSIAVIIAFAGGRPGMISAATAAVAVLVVPLVRDHGVEYLFAATILMGILQIDRRLPAARPADAVRLALGDHRLRQRARDPDLHGAAAAADRRAAGRPIAMVAAGLAIIYLFPRLTKAVPSPLVAIVVLTALSISLGHRRQHASATWASCPTTLPVVPDPRRAASRSRRCGSSCPIRWPWRRSGCSNR